MTTAFQYRSSTPGIQSLLTTELNSLVNGSFATDGGEYDNTDKDFWGDFELVADAGSNFTANATCDLYLLTAIDGTNYAGTSGPPPGAYVGSFVMQAEHPGRYILRGVPLPPCKFKAYLKNGSGQNFAASANTLKMLPYSQQGS